MSVAIIKNDRYTVDPLYQWDLNQVLEIRGLSLPSIPEIHFTNDAMDRAIVKQASMDAAGVITVDVPNSLLQKPYTIKAYVCIYEGETFQSLYRVTIPVKARKRPADYTLESTDGEVYSFTAMENRIANLASLIADHNGVDEELIHKYVNLGANLEKKYNDTAKNVTDTLEAYSETIDGFSEDLGYLKTYVTPQMFGAVGDGSKNDNVSFQNAIDFLSDRGGGILLIPNGNYDVSGGKIVVKSNIKIIGVGNPRLFTKPTTGYFSIFRNDNIALENVEISGLIIDQWADLSIQPNNEGAPYCCIAFLGKCSNIIIKDNLFYSVGGWTISVTDTVDNYGSSNVYITNNKINWKQAGDGTWYDASAIYAETDNHIIEHNYIESFRGDREPSSRWKSEGGIETHGVGLVRWNEIRNVQAGINVVEHAYDRTTELKTKREIAYNTMRSVSRGLWFWIPKAPYGMENFEIYSNDIEVVAEGYYPGFGAICCTLTEKDYTDSTNHYNGYLKDIKIYNNKFYFIDNAYTGVEYLDVKNVGAISFGASGIVKNVEIYNNDIVNFPWPAIVTYQWDADISRYYSDFNIYNNTVIDCGYGMSNEYQRCVFLMYHADRVYIHDNTVKWINRNETGYLVGGGANCDIFEYVNNKQISENDFATYGTLITSADQNKTGFFIDLKNQGYRTYNGDPTGNLTPKIIGERVFDSVYKRWFVAVGETDSSWRTEASKEKGVVTINIGETGVSVYHGLSYVPTHIQVTPLGNLGNVYVSFVSSDRFIISCTESPQESVKICWEAEI